MPYAPSQRRDTDPKIPSAQPPILPERVEPLSGKSDRYSLCQAKGGDHLPYLTLFLLFGQARNAGKTAGVSSLSDKKFPTMQNSVGK